MKFNFKSLVILCLFVATINASAQTDEFTPSESRFKLGIAVGLNAPTFFSNYTNPSLEPETKMRPGYNFGITMDYLLNKKISFGSGVFLSSKGFSNASPEFDDADNMERFTINYIEVPLQLRYHLSDRLRVHAGPYFALGLGGDNYGMIDGVDVETLNYVPKSGEVNTSDLAEDEIPFQLFDFGVNVGVGYTVFKNFSVQAGYSLGLRNINNDIVEGTTKIEAKDFKDFNSVLSLSFMYSFEL